MNIHTYIRILHESVFVTLVPFYHISLVFLVLLRQDRFAATPEATCLLVLSFFSFRIIYLRIMYTHIVYIQMLTSSVSWNAQGIRPPRIPSEQNSRIQNAFFPSSRLVFSNEACNGWQCRLALIPCIYVWKPKPKPMHMTHHSCLNPYNFCFIQFAIE